MQGRISKKAALELMIDCSMTAAKNDAVADAMTRAVATINSSKSAAEAARLMADRLPAWVASLRNTREAGRRL